jgi:acetyltransferase
VVGGSNDVTKPGGKVLKNLIDGDFRGNLYVLNLKDSIVQGIKSYKNADELPDTDLAIIAIAAKYTLDMVTFLTEQKNTRAFIILSAGFSEVSEEGKKLENQIVKQINKYNGSLIGPNCIGILTPNYHGVFTKPIPKLHSSGCDFISGSGATACFIMEAGIPKGLTFANVFSVGNSAQMGVEEILQYLDENFNGETSSRVKLLYLETIDKPKLLLKHAASLINKGCKIVAIKAGTSEAGSRAATSHTGALASPDDAVDALFQKAGIVRCYSREEMITIASIFMHPDLKGKNIAVITHAGGPAVMLTDALSANGLEVPVLTGTDVTNLKKQLFEGSSVANPIDFLATGTAEQLGIIIDYINDKFLNIDGMVVIFGTPGLIPIHHVYDILDMKMKTSRVPIFPVLPSTLTAEQEVAAFLDKGRINFPDGVFLGRALSKIFYTPKPEPEFIEQPAIDKARIRNIINEADNGYLKPEKVQALLDAAQIPRVPEKVVHSVEEALSAASEMGFPLAMKVVGPVHKSDVGGVVLNINNEVDLANEFERMIGIKDTTGILVQPMLSGIELFAGSKFEPKFGHLILFGLGGILIEVLQIVKTALAPVSNQTALHLIASLKGKKILEGVRGKAGADIGKFAEVITRVSALVTIAPEIIEMDLNPLLGYGSNITAVDARINIQK